MNPIAQQEDEDSDYDVFAAVRPRGISVDDNLSDELDGEDVDEFLEMRPNPSEIAQVKDKKQKGHTVAETAKDVAKQASKGFLIGAGGTWGDLAELAGIRNDKPIPGQKEKRQREFDTLEKMQQPGYKPSAYDIAELTDDSDTVGAFHLPTSKSLGEFNELIGGPGEAETTPGRYAERAGKISGSTLSTIGSFGFAPSVIAGIAGQTVEELGGGPLAQAAAEIAALLASPGSVGKKLAQSTEKTVNRKINDLRKLGYPDEDITLAINSASQGKVGGFKASKGEATQEAFSKALQRSDELVNDVLTSSIPGIEKGTKHVHQVASDVYGNVASKASKLNIKDSTEFINSATKIVKELRKNLGNNAEQVSFINRLHDAVIASTKNPTAEHFMEFYKELNKMGNWMARSQKDRLINIAKDGIKDTFRSEGPAGRKLAEEFEKANVGIRKAYQAEEVHDLIQKATTQEGIDYRKMYKLYNNPENVQLFEEVLGTQQANNLRQIANTGKEITDFDKAWKGVNALDKTVGNVGSVGYYLMHMNWSGLMGALGIKSADIAVRRLMEKSLTDPKFQNLIVRGLHAVKNQSPKSLRSALDGLQKEIDDEGLEININQLPSKKYKDKQTK